MGYESSHYNFSGSKKQSQKSQIFQNENLNKNLKLNLNCLKNVQINYDDSKLQLQNINKKRRNIVLSVDKSSSFNLQTPISPISLSDRRQSKQGESFVPSEFEFANYQIRTKEKGLNIKKLQDLSISATRKLELSSLINSPSVQNRGKFCFKDSYTAGNTMGSNVINSILHKKEKQNHSISKVGDLMHKINLKEEFESSRFADL